MLDVTINVTNNLDITEDIKNKLMELSKMQVLVGISEERSSRGEEITNAELAFIHTNGIRKREMIDDMQPNLNSGMQYKQAYDMYIQTHGSPFWHSPPRPIIEPAIEDSKEAIAEQLREAIQATLEGKDGTIHLKKAGMLGANASKAWFENSKNGWAPNSPLTIAKKGSDVPLIDTGELRKSITYIIREK